MPKQPYRKPPTTRAEQIARLRERGMVIADEAAAEFVLTHINYYRLGAYWLPFEADHLSHLFREGTRFDQVMALYEFDRHLRLLVLDAIERFEVSVRTQWTYHLSHAHGAHAHLNPKIHQQSWWRNNITSMETEVERADEVFIQHLQRKYKEKLPPIWAVSEVISLGLLSRCYKSINVFRLKKQIADTYGISHTVLASWLQHLSVVRNICAHHSRLWNRQFDRIAPKEPERGAAPLQGAFVDGHPLYNTLIILLYLMDIINTEHGWRGRLLMLIEEHPDVPLSDIGFPTDWKAKKVWRP